jgi:sugar lactone lactonase YvrE
MNPTTLVPLESGLVFAEGPRWHDGMLWLSDMYGGRVLTVAADGALTTVATVEGRPSGLGFLPDGTPLVVSMEQHAVLRIDAGATSTHADLAHLARGHINDMLVTPSGRAYVGCFGFDFLGGESPKPAPLIAIEPDGTARIVAEDLMFPNGMALSDDGETLYLAEMLAGRITAFRVLANGDLTDRRMWAELPDRTPDGIALDADGCLWVASSLTAELLHVAEGGEVLTAISTAPRLAPACVLGGDDGTTLFALLAETSPAELAQGISKSVVQTFPAPAPAAGRS